MARPSKSVIAMFAWIRIEESIDFDKPVYLSLFGIWSKKSGYAVLSPAPPRPRSWSWPTRASSGWPRPRTLRCSSTSPRPSRNRPTSSSAGPDLKDAKRVTDTNPFQSKYAWGHSELIEYKSSNGTRLQGIALLSGGIRARQEVPHDRLYVRETVGRPASLQRAIGAQLLQRQRDHQSRLLPACSPTSCFTKREPGPFRRRLRHRGGEEGARKRRSR